MSWQLVYDGFEPDEQGLREALCTLGNGHLATRGALACVDADDVHYPGCYLAGGYDRLTTEIRNREVENEDLVNLPNWLPLRLRIGDGDWLHPDRAALQDFRQELDLKRGVLTIRYAQEDSFGRRLEICETRLVHMARAHVLAQQTTITARGWSGPITMEAGLDGSVENRGVARYRDLASRHLVPITAEALGDGTLFLRMRFAQARLELALAQRNRICIDDRPQDIARRIDATDDRVAETMTLELADGQTVGVEKTVALFTSRDRAISEPGLAACTELATTPRFAPLLAEHARAWEQLWRRADIEIEPDGRTLTILRLHIFHLLGTVSPNSVDRDIGVPARGWTGEAYRGHVFWDELFIFPFLDLRLPELTRGLLLYRWRRLDAARRAARAEGYEGAMFPWQSGSDGREETQTLHLNPHSGRWKPDNSHRQRHVGLAIAYNLWRHWQISGDLEFLYAYGAEMLLEIARFFASLATHDPARDRWSILGVMGPDEYHDSYPDRDEAGLDDNAYTNVMAAWTLHRALDLLEILPSERRRELEETLGLGPADYERWRDVGRKLRVPFHGDGIISQFDGFERLEPFDWEGYRARYDNIQRLDRILEAENDSPNRYQVCKQADVLMLFYLFSCEELTELFERLGYPFEGAMIPKNIAYWEARTSHGSTLSRVVHSWVLARGDRPRAWRLFCEALESDIADIQGGTTAEGIHLGAMAGTVDLLQQGFTGIEPRPDGLWFNPCLPDEVKALRMRLRFRGHWLEIHVGQDRLEVGVHRDAPGPVCLGCRTERRSVAPGEATVFDLA